MPPTALLPLAVTRPQAAGAALADALCAASVDARWVPAFDLLGPADPAAARRALAQLADADLAVFVSPAAVEHTAALLPGPWPVTTAIGAVGGATARAVRTRLALPAGVALVAPEGAADDVASGSEALAQALAASGRMPRRVLILRAAGGRDWLAEHLAAGGAQVDAVAVYRRQPHACTPAEADWLERRAAAGPLAALVTSSEAVAVAQAAWPARAWQALLRGRALATHPRIAAHLSAAGVQDVRTSTLDVADIRPLLQLPAP
jgi:uroporphyrinogen-III synthase